MALSEKIIQIVKYFEGFNLEAYPDGKKFAIGYGNHYYENGNEVKQGDTITQERADKLLVTMLGKYYKYVITDFNNFYLSEQHKEALASLYYNYGPNNQKLKKLVSFIKTNNITNYDVIEPEYLKLCSVNGKYNQLLAKRRASEFYYYKTGEVNINPKIDYNAIKESLNETMVENKTTMLSSDSQVQYNNTNYCNTIICDEDTIEPISGSNTISMNKQETEIDVTWGLEAMYFLCQICNITLSSDIKKYGLGPWKMHKSELSQHEKINSFQFTSDIYENISLQPSKPPMQISFAIVTVNIRSDQTYSVRISERSNFKGRLNEIVTEINYKGYQKANPQQSMKTIYHSFNNLINNHNKPSSEDSLFDVFYKESSYTVEGSGIDYLNLKANNELDLPSKRLTYYLQVTNVPVGGAKGVLVVKFLNNSLVYFGVADNRGMSGGWNYVQLILENT